MKTTQQKPSLHYIHNMLGCYRPDFTLHKYRHFYHSHLQKRPRLVNKKIKENTGRCLIPQINGNAMITLFEWSFSTLTTHMGGQLLTLLTIFSTVAQRVVCSAMMQKQEVQMITLNSLTQESSEKEKGLV